MSEIAQLVGWRNIEIRRNEEGRLYIVAEIKNAASNLLDPHPVTSHDYERNGRIESWETMTFLRTEEPQE